MGPRHSLSFSLLPAPAQPNPSLYQPPNVPQSLVQGGQPRVKRPLAGEGPGPWDSGRWREPESLSSQLVQIKIRSKMTITTCSGLTVFPQKLIVLQTREINCLKSQVDWL